MKPSRWIPAAFLLAVVSTAVFAQTSQFVYQGSLKDGGSRANGAYDFEFLLFDAQSGGTQIGPTVARPGVPVSDGVFSVKLDFGVNAFPITPDRFVETRVRPAGGGSFTTLVPRERIATAPYAFTSLNAGKADLATNATNALTASNSNTLGGLPPSNFLQTGSAILNQTTQQAASSFNIGGTGTAATINALTSYELNGLTVLRSPTLFSLYIGRDAGVNATMHSLNTYVGNNAGYQGTTGQSNTYFGANAGFDNVTGSHNSFFGQQAGANSKGSNNSFFGSRADVPLGNTNITNATAIGALSEVSASNSVVLGSVAGVNGASSSTNVGIGITAPRSKLHVVGGSIFIAQPNSLIITSPDGKCWFITVNNAGALSTNPVTCP